MIWNTPIYIGRYKVKNRIAFPPISGNWAASDGSVTDRILNFYRRVAKGGCGMVIVSGTAISPEGKGTDRSLCLDDAKNMDSFEKLSKLIKENNCFVSIQLMHVGGQGNPNFTGYTPVSPSGIKCMATGYLSREISLDEIGRIRRQFINSSSLAYRAGFQAIELHVAHGYLLHEFLSPHTNKRRDNYGGSVFNRVRLILEIIGGVRKGAPGLLIGVRVSAEDYLRDGINPEINRLYLPFLEEAGVDYFSITAGIYETSLKKHEAMRCGDFFRYSREIKSIVTKPVIGVGKILDLESAEKHLLNGDCDMVAIGRGLVADPFMIEKAKKGEQFSRCIECEECQYLRLGRKEMSCSQWERKYA
jgi:2,4-dienoyl-CoA reductase-like NADH-dependent reductase (Old Yellow Enzyme family)